MNHVENLGRKPFKTVTIFELVYTYIDTSKASLL